MLLFGMDRAALPVAFPLARHWMTKSSSGDHEILSTVRLPAVIFAPRHFVCVGMQIRSAYMVVRAELRAAQPGEIGLGLVGVPGLMASFATATQFGG